MTEKEKMIPLSIIDARIKELEGLLPHADGKHPMADELYGAIVTLRNLKKEVIPSPSPSELEDVMQFRYDTYEKEQSPLEQKIKDRISELEKKWKDTCQKMYATHFTEPLNLTSYEKIGLGAIPSIIKELRKLLE